MGKAVRVLITGGWGFAARHTIDHLLETTDWEVVTLDSPKQGAKTYADDRLARFVHDLRTPISWQLDEAIGEVDAVLHLAAAADVHKFLKKPMGLTLNNVTSTVRLLEWARTRTLSHFVLVSSNEIYGPTAPTDFTGTREWSPIAPPTPYSGSKAAQEALAISWWRTFEVPVVITNTMQLFGPGQPPERFIPTVVRRLVSGQLVNVYAERWQRGWRSARRCWTYVLNHADALRWLLTQPAQQWPHDDRPSRWNIAGPEWTCERIVRRVAEILELDPKIEFTESASARPGHELRYALDTSKISDAGWEPPWSFEDALADTVTELARSIR